MSKLRKTRWKLSDMQDFLELTKYSDESEEQRLTKFICVCLLNAGNTTEQIEKIISDKDMMESIKLRYM